MKNPLSSKASSLESLSRREFIAKSSAAAVGFTIVPRRVLGGLGYVPPSDKVNIAFVGVGAQGLRVMLHFLKEPDVQGVAVCDPNRSGANYPQWSTHEFCNSVRKLLGVDSGWDWLSPDQPIQLTHSLAVTGGVAGREPCSENRRRLQWHAKSLRTVARLCGLQQLPRVARETERLRRRSSCAPPTICTLSCLRQR